MKISAFFWLGWGNLLFICYNKLNNVFVQTLTQAKILQSIRIKKKTPSFLNVIVVKNAFLYIYCEFLFIFCWLFFLSIPSSGFCLLSLHSESHGEKRGMEEERSFYFVFLVFLWSRDTRKLQRLAVYNCGKSVHILFWTAS